MYLNKAIIIGNLTRDPEKRAMPSGNAVTSFSVATNSVWKDKDGMKKEATEFHNIVVFGRPAENCAQYLKKGQSVLVEGRMQTRSWDDQTSGQKKYRTEVVADRVQFGPKAMGGASQGASGTAAGGAGFGASQSSPSQESAPPLDTIEYPEEQSNPDDIPF
ncbi:MAG: single-stranded DNA-binding protein [Candidatus Vogelbacteria bacterium CG10_big_fil_rev_8_21_14_0_10_51_16]|uniref:Single-stranded DNA-binding protein n=1 Tax=Candidatus Vogelbacteria bacterium CG10_big_fil_rev_8_21_14_0_10_51_16 TaxID=1975045 RepID=A0A2H0RDB2_9BACT|nr:MAG: single-stranded DNA-binding protein [Candidatus Vogelbacteria bacterium CG10_big_fil_rev_8_21_14_0_10_51_16]